MRLITSIFTLLFFMLSAQAQANDSAPQGAYGGDVALLKHALQTVHPGYKRYISEARLAGAWAELEAQTAQNELEPLPFYAAVSKLLATLRCDHTKAELPESLKEIKKRRFLPFRFRLFNQRMFVSASTHPEFKRGVEITHIDGVPVQAAITQL